MYDVLDRPVAELPDFERETLLALRRWVHAVSLAPAGAALPADDPLGRALQALDRGSSSEIVVQRPCFATVEEPEAVLLGIWQLVRRGDATAARGVIAMLVDPRSATILFDAVCEMVRASA